MSKAFSQSSAVIGGRTPFTGSHFVMDKPDSVSLSGEKTWGLLVVVVVFLFFYKVIRDWSLITRKGGLQNGKIVGLKLCAPPPPPQERVKLFAPPPPFKECKLFAPPPPFKECKLFARPFNMAKTSSYCVKTTPKFVVPPPPFTRLKPLFVGTKLHMPPSP